MDADLERVLHGLPVGDGHRCGGDRGPRGRRRAGRGADLGDRAPAEHDAAGTAAPPGATPPAGYYGYEGPPRRRRPIWPWVLAVLLLAAAGVAAWFAYTKIQDQLNSSKPVPVPSVIDLASSWPRTS